MEIFRKRYDKIELWILNIKWRNGLLIFIYENQVIQMLNGMLRLNNNWFSSVQYKFGETIGENGVKTRNYETRKGLEYFVNISRKRKYSFLFKFHIIENNSY